MVFYILRGSFLILVAAVSALYLISNQFNAQVGFWQFVIIMVAALALAGGIILADTTAKEKRLSALSGVFLGLIVGLVVAFALGFVVDLIGLLTSPARPTEMLTMSDMDQLARRSAYLNLLQGVKVVIGLITCYLSISLILQTKDDFRFVIPYVEFAKEVRGNRPMLLDTSVIIDGRILDILETKIFQGSLVVPKFVLTELQAVADSGDKLRRARGRRGLEILQKLQDNTSVDLQMDQNEAEGPTVDQKLVSLAQSRQARIMTNDFNLNKIATLRGVDVVNINDLAKALRPVAMPGENMRIKIIKPGEGTTQGVGYLDDGTMVVVENARGFLGQEVDLMVTSTLQTSAGRMIFGRCTEEDAGSNGMGQDGSGHRTYRTPPPLTARTPAPPTERNPRQTT